MDKLKKYCTWEITTEMYASGYTLGFLGMYCIAAWINGKREVGIIMILQMLIVAYVIAFIQNIIFLNNRKLTDKEYKIRVVLWHLSSNIIGLLSAIGLGWFQEFQLWITIFFIIFMISMFTVVWILMSVNREVDTENLNNILIEYKKNSKE